MMYSADSVFNWIKTFSDLKKQSQEAAQVDPLFAHDLEKIKSLYHLAVRVHSQRIAKQRERFVSREAS